MHNNIGTVLQGLAQVRGGEGVVHHQRNFGGLGNGRKFCEVEHFGARIGE